MESSYDNQGQGIIAGVNKTSNNFIAGNNAAGNDISPVSFTPVNSLSMALITLAINKRL